MSVGVFDNVNILLIHCTEHALLKQLNEVNE